MEWVEMPTEEGWYWVQFRGIPHVYIKCISWRQSMERWYLEYDDDSEEIEPGKYRFYGPLVEPEVEG